MSETTFDWSPDYRELVDRNLGLLTEEQQERLRLSHIVVFGAGGLGGTILELLVRSGVGRLSVVDRDTYEPTNMNRQVFATHNTLGQRKIDAAEARALDINPELWIAKYERVEADNVGEILSGASLGIMAIDQLRPCLVISRAARELEIPLVEGWALPYGNVRVIVPEGASLEELYSLRTQGRPLESISDEEIQQLGFEVLMGLSRIDGVAGFYREEALERIAGGWIPSFGPIVWLTAVLMTLEAMKVILGLGDLALGPGFALYDPFRHRVPAS